MTTLLIELPLICFGAKRISEHGIQVNNNFFNKKLFYFRSQPYKMFACLVSQHAFMSPLVFLRYSSSYFSKFVICTKIFLKLAYRNTHHSSPDNYVTFEFRQHFHDLTAQNTVLSSKDSFNMWMMILPIQNDIATLCKKQLVSPVSRNLITSEP